MRSYNLDKGRFLKLFTNSGLHVVTGVTLDSSFITLDSKRKKKD